MCVGGKIWNLRWAEKAHNENLILALGSKDCVHHYNVGLESSVNVGTNFYSKLVFYEDKNNTTTQTNDNSM